MRRYRYRLAIAAALLLLAVGAIGAWLNRPAPADPGPDARGLAWILDDQYITVEGSDDQLDVDQVREILADIPASTTTIDGYDRDAFGEPWLDADGNGCDTRNDILRRDLDDIQVKPDSWCKVQTGVLDDPYTGASISFQRGEDTSALVQIDHVVPLAWAWRHGAGDWDADRRVKFANDPVELLAVDGDANNAKADSGPAEWLPADIASRCGYVAVFTLVTAQYELSIGDADRAAIADTLSSCA